MAPKHYKGEGHRKRLREKFLASGLSGFHDYEVIELLLTIGTPRRDCKDAAKAAIARFKTIPGVLEAPVEELKKIPGIGEKNLFGLKIVPAVAERYLEQRIKKTDPISNSKQLFEYLQATMSAKGRERFRVLFLDAKNRVLASEDLFVGTLTAGAVYPREVIRAALGRQAAALIFAHNHPSGDPAPSAADISITRKLVFACRSVDITVHEHIVIGDNTYYSFADQGHIARMQREYDHQMQKISESCI